MRSLLPLLTALFVCFLSSATLAVEAFPDLKTGDIVFQQTTGTQSRAVHLATHSNWSHCGIVLRFRKSWWVLEASRTTQLTPLKKFISRSSENGSWAIYRYKKRVTDQALQAALEYGKAQLGKPYDFKFAWGESHQYCSELVWKVYNAAGVSLCAPKSFSDYDLSSPEVKSLILTRYEHRDRLPKNIKVVAPSDLASSHHLKLVYQS